MLVSRRRELKGIAAGISSSFSSRYNDIDGYWGLGVIYLCAAEAGLSKFQLDLISGESLPYFKHSKKVATPYREYLKVQAEKKGFHPWQICKAIIEIEFNTMPSKLNLIFKRTWGEAFLCTVSITDDLGKSWSHQYEGWCGKHDPAKEHRSTRRYAS